MTSSDSDLGNTTGNRNSSKETPGASSSTRYRFRSDLQIVRGADVAGSVTVIDPQSGQRHVLTADEFCLCRAADGANTLAAIRQAFKAETGREISHSKLFGFFRRLRSLGLLEGASDKLEPPTQGYAGETPEPGVSEAASELDSLAGDDAIGSGPGDFKTRLGVRIASEMLGGGRDLGGVQSFLADLATRGRARQEGPPEAGEPARVSLFNPNALLGILAALIRPLKFGLVLILLVVPAAIWIVCQHQDMLAADIRSLDVSVAGTVILSLAIVSLISRLTQGAFIRGFGGEVKQFGIALTFGVPRFFIDLGAVTQFVRRGQLWAHAAPMFARLGLFGVGAILWFALRQATPWLSHLALVISGIGLLAFLLCALPLLPSDGYRWLATYVGRPALRSDVFHGIGGLFTTISRGALPADIRQSVRAASAEILYVAAVVLGVLALALVVQAYLDLVTTGAVQALTALTLFGVGVGLGAWGVALRNYRRHHDIEAFDAAAATRLITPWTGAPDIASDRPASIGTIGKVLWAIILAALVAVAFLPYRYEAAGTFEILPAQRTKVSARTSGEVEQILVHEGDWVTANQVVAKISSEDQERAIAITSAELDRAKAQLAQFGGEAQSPGTSELEQSLADAFKDGADNGGAKKDATTTNYLRTQAERAARAEVERLTRRLAYERDQLAQTEVRAPTEGRVMTPNVRLLTGTWVRQGGDLMILADTRTLEAEINLPEADIGVVKVGDKVRLRPWSNEDSEIAGTVTDIAPAAQLRPYGMIVRVSASIPNTYAVLLPAMTGYAKIDGEEMHVWQAFLRRIIRTVRVEMWSWIP